MATNYNQVRSPRSTTPDTNLYTQLLASGFPDVQPSVGSLESSELLAGIQELVQRINGDSTVNEVSQETNARPGNFLNYLTTDPAALASQDLGSHLYRLGSAIGTNPNGSNITNTQVARNGRALSILGHSGAALTMGAQNVLAGIANQRRQNEFWEEWQQYINSTNERAVQYLKNGGKIEKFASGGQVKGVEVEDGEIIRDPQGNVQEVEGKTHEQGGEKMLLQIGSEVTSDNRKIGKTGVGKFNEMFGGLKLQLKPSDTYADVVRKVEKKIGLEGVDEDIEKSTKKLENLPNNNPNTYNLNASYLQNKIAKLQEERDVLEQSRLKAVDMIFDVQEQSKGSRQSGQTLMQQYKDGGLITDNQMEILQRKTGLPKTYIQGVISRAQKSALEKMEDGGKVYFQKVLNSFAQPEYGYQPFTQTSIAGATTSGNVTSDTFTNRLNETLRIFPRAIEYFDVTRDENGNATNLKFKSPEAVKEYQQYVNKVYKNISDYADRYIDNETQRDQLKNYVQGLEFDTSNPDSVRFTDNIFGDFTSSRSGVALPLVTRDELDRLSEQGISNFSQLFDANGNLQSDVLSETTAQNLQRIRDNYGNDFEAILTSLGTESNNQSNQQPVNPVQQTNQNNQETQLATRFIDPSSDLNNDGYSVPQANSSFVLPYLPNQYRYDFDSPIAPMRGTVRYGRVTPARREFTSQLQAINDAEGLAASASRGFADPQRLAVSSSNLAQTISATNQAIAEVESWNAQNRQTVDMYNVQQSDREVDANLREDRTYEQLAMTALANTENNNELLRNHNRQVRLGNFNTAVRLRAINNLVPNYRVDQYGSVVYDPNSPSPFATPQGGIPYDELLAALESYNINR